VGYKLWKYRDRGRLRVRVIDRSTGQVPISITKSVLLRTLFVRGIDSETGKKAQLSLRPQKTLLKEKKNYALRRRPIRPRPSRPRPIKERLAGSGTADVLEYWFVTWETDALPVLEVAPKSLVIQSWVVGVILICWSSEPGLETVKIVQLVLNPPVQYFSEKTVVPFPVTDPLKPMERSSINVPGAAVTRKLSATS